MTYKFSESLKKKSIYLGLRKNFVLFQKKEVREN